MGKLKYFAILVFAIASMAQTFWDFEKIERGHARWEQSHTEINLLRPDRSFIMPEWRSNPRFSYPYHLAKLCDWWAFWQLMDVDSIEHGGIIEAETGELRHVIQTDNTQEVVWCWAFYTNRSGDSTYLENIDSAWIYLSNFPAYEEELSYIGGSFISYYYRVWNSALGLLMVQGLRDFLGEDYTSYADSCVDIILNHRLSMDTPWPSIDGLHALVTAFSAGCLYQYGIDRERADWCDSALTIAGTVQPWIDRNPSGHLAYSNWAMSSGTVIWGLMNSRFAAFPESLDLWLDAYGDHIPERIEPPASYDPYVWDNSWNIWFSNAFRHIWKSTGDDEWYLRYRTILDDLLAQDTDDDGGIPASAAGPDYEDMTWISAYLTLYSMDWIIDSLPEIDIGALNPTVHMPKGFATPEDTVYVLARAANFGRSPVDDVHVVVTKDWGILLDETVDLRWGGVFPTETLLVVPGAEGIHVIEVHTHYDDDEPWNDTARVEFFATPVRSISGSIFDPDMGCPLSGVASEVKFFYLGEDTSFFYTSDSSSEISTVNLDIALPCLDFRIEISPEFPYVPVVIETFTVYADSTNFLSVPVHRADLLLVDDDLGRNYEQYYMTTLDSLGVSYRVWDRSADGNVAPEISGDMRKHTVIWFTGDDTTTTLDSADLYTIDYIVRNGGNVLLTGQGICEDLATLPEFESMFGAIWLGGDGLPIISGVPDDPISAGFRDIVTFGSTDAAGNQQHRDRLSPVSPAIGFLKYPCEASAGIRREDPISGGKLVFIGFGIEGISHPAANPAYSGRPEVMEAILTWFDPSFYIDEHVLPDKLDIQAFPNPFNSSVRVVIDGVVERMSPIRVEVFDLTGRSIDLVTASSSDEANVQSYEIDNIKLSPDRESIIELIWTPAEFVTSGVYLVRVKTDNTMKSKKIVYVK